MALIKTTSEIEKMARGGALLSQALTEAVKAALPGVLLSELDEIAERILVENGAKPSFKGYQSYEDDPPFPSTLCASLNDEVVHGIATRQIALKEGDVLSLDIGCWYEGLCTDMATTIAIGDISDEAKKLMIETRASLLKGIEAAIAGNEVADISRAVANHLEPFGYGIIRDLVGHGVGHAIHESPHIPNFISKRPEKIILQEGMCLAIEPMVTLGDWRVDTADDGWSILTRDGSLAAHFEATIALTKNGPRILTPLPII